VAQLFCRAMDTEFPSADAYADESIRHAALEIFDVAAEQRAVTSEYRNMVLCRVNSSCLRLAVFNGTYRWHHHPNSDELFLVVEGVLELARYASSEIRPAAPPSQSRANGPLLRHCPRGE
jgi:hypothetical protein